MSLIMFLHQSSTLLSKINAGNTRMYKYNIPPLDILLPTTINNNIPTLYDY